MMVAADLVLLRVRALEAERDALVDALRLLSVAVELHGVCVCGHDGELTSVDCPLHGVGATKASRMLAVIVEKRA